LVSLVPNPGIVNVNLSLCFTKHRTMKTYYRCGGIAVRFLNLSTRRGELSASCPGLFTPGKRAPVTYWMAGCVGPRAENRQGHFLPCHFQANIHSHVHSRHCYNLCRWIKNDTKSGMSVIWQAILSTATKIQTHDIVTTQVHGHM